MSTELEQKVEQLTKQVAELSSKVEEQAAALKTLSENQRISTGNLNFLKDLAHEAVALTEQSSSISLEQFNTLDSRMNDVAEIAHTRILNYIAKIPQMTEAVEAVKTEWNDASDKQAV